MKFTKEIAENLKSQPLEVQLKTLLEYIDNEIDPQYNKDNYLPFNDLLKDLQEANKAIKNSTRESFYQDRVDYVINKRKSTTNV